MIMMSFHRTYLKYFAVGIDVLLLICCSNEIKLLLGNGYTSRGGNSIKCVLFHFWKKRFILKGKICSRRGQILSFSGRPIFIRGADLQEDK